MSPFRRTLRLLDEERPQGWRTMLVVITALLAAWAMWFVFARVPVYESSASARIETAETAHSIDAPQAGRVVASSLVLGRRVHAGDVVVELEAEPLVLEQRELETKHRGLENEIDAVERELRIERIAAQQAIVASDLAESESKARYDEGQAAATLAAEEFSRAERLHRAGLIGDLELLRSRAEEQKRRAGAAGLQVAVRRQRADDDLKEKERLARAENLQRELVSLRGQERSIVVNIERATGEIERRRVRTPISGILADVAALQSGAVVAQGDRLATVIAGGRLQVVASFKPNAIGRLRRGQSGRLLLTGYPWQQYGAMRVVVERVASELRASQIRVELRLDSRPSAIPLQHAQPGTVEIEVERISPATMVLRAAGRRAS